MISTYFFVDDPRRILNYYWFRFLKYSILLDRATNQTDCSVRFNKIIYQTEERFPKLFTGRWKIGRGLGNRLRESEMSFKRQGKILFICFTDRMYFLNILFKVYKR